jgi:transposase
MHAVRRPRGLGWPLQLAGDKGYSYDSVRQFLRCCGIDPVIPRRENQPRPKYERFDKKTYRKRCRIEQSVGWLKECRRLGTRYEKLALNFLAFVKLGIMLKYLRVLDSSDRA